MKARRIAQIKCLLNKNGKDTNKQQSCYRINIMIGIWKQDKCAINGPVPKAIITKQHYIVFFWTHWYDVPTRLVDLIAHSHIFKRKRCFGNCTGSSRPNTCTLSNEQYIYLHLRSSCNENKKKQNPRTHRNYKYGSSLKRKIYSKKFNCSLCRLYLQIFSESQSKLVASACFQN